MKKILYSLILSLIAMTYTSCDDVETYAEQRDAEYAAIDKYVSKNNIKVISEEEFLKDTTTDVSKNEYVLFEGTGVYMQIVNRGCGEMLKKGETSDVLSRFTEYNINNEAYQLSNNTFSNSYQIEKFSVSNVSGSFYASFDTSNSLLYNRYGSASVPSGWLIPLSYVKIGRLQGENDELAKVNIIVPHDQGHSSANQGVYACFYTITYQRGAN